jgi:hypothetical protein
VGPSHVGNSTVAEKYDKKQNKQATFFLQNVITLNKPKKTETYS